MEGLSREKWEVKKKKEEKTTKNPKPLAYIYIFFLPFSTLSGYRRPFPPAHFFMQAECNLGLKANRHPLKDDITWEKS